VSGTSRQSDTSLDLFERIFPGDSEMAGRMRALDWSRTDLGPPASWPESLRTAVSICLTSRFPIVLWWGPDLTLLYNDAYISVLGPGKHPQWLGRSGRECWSDIWDTIGPMLTGVMRSGEATWSEELPLSIDRHLPREEGYFTFSYSPILTGDAAHVGGIFCAVTETTDYVLGRRRAATLRELGQRLANLASAEGALERAAEVLAANPHDVPTAAFYLVDRARDEARLAASMRVDPAGSGLPARLALDDDSTWPIGAVWRSRQAMEVLLPGAPDAWSGGPWPEPPRQALVLPVSVSGFDGAGAVIVVGVSPRRMLDASYRDFFASIAAQIGAAMTEALAYEAERRRAESLAELDRAKTAFFSNVSHEFRTPLTLMLGPLEDALSDGDETLGNRTAERIELAYRNSLRLLKLVNTLLDFSRIEAGRVEAVFEETDLGGYTEELASVFRSAFERAGLSLEVSCAKISAPVFIDRDMWEKVLLNLLSNAFKFTFTGGASIRVHDAGERAVVEVRDTGIGIPPHELANVFERFHRVKGAQARTHEGTGIGLALVQELVKLHGGTVRVESDLGVGTTFIVSIPTGSAHLPPERVNAARTLASTALGAAPYLEEALRWLPDAREAPLVAGDAAGAARVSTAGARILVADDNQDLRDYLRRLLSAHWVVDAVADGEAALERATAAPPDLVLADVMMPKRDGFALLRALRENPSTRTLPVILLSARAGEEARVEGLDAGADDYLIKPFSARELVARVNTHLELARVRREADVERQKLLAIAEQARCEAERANQAKDEFLAVLSHELRSPMNAMLGWVQLLQQHSADGELVARAARTLERNIGVQTQVINDLLDVSRIVSGRFEVEHQWLDLAALLRLGIDSQRPSAEGRQIDLHLEIESEPLAVSGDPARLQQVVANLLGNAIKFTPTGGSIRVTASRAGGQALLRVEDSGEGIAPEFVPLLFDRFSQANRGATRRHGGLGIGLSIVKTIVALHGGEVHAESAGVGRGATFVVALPLARVGEAEPPRPESQPVPIDIESSLRLDLLLVEDDPDTREALVIALRRCGRVRAVASVQEALEAYSSRRPDLVVSDIGMPGEDGYALIRTIRDLEEGRAPRTLALAMTGFAGRRDHELALRAGFDDHVAKPVDPRVLMDRIRVLAASRGRRTALRPRSALS
jgi:signal transduction histidine kinase